MYFEALKVEVIVFSLTIEFGVPENIPINFFFQSELLVVDCFKYLLAALHRSVIKGRIVFNINFYKLLSRIDFSRKKKF